MDVYHDVLVGMEGVKTAKTEELSWTILLLPLDPTEEAACLDMEMMFADVDPFTYQYTCTICRA